MSSEEGGVRSVATGGRFAEALRAFFACLRAGLREVFPARARRLAFFGRLAAFLGLFFARLLAMEILSNP